MSIANYFSRDAWLTSRAYLYFLLIAISVFILMTAPRLWYYTPDGGIYIGTAINLLNNGEYAFNGYPNLLYYPGLSTLLALPISLFGLDFHYLNVFSALLVIGLLWTLSLYYDASKFGPAMVLLPLIFFSSSIFQEQTYNILSDAPFMLVVVMTIIFWGEYAKTQSNTVLIICMLLAATAPLIRFEGVIVMASFCLTVLISEYLVSRRIVSTLVKTGIISVLVFLPFSLWTLRNYQLHTPDTFNMANGFFFGLKGLSMNAPDFKKVEWLEPGSAKYGLYNLYFNIKAIASIYIGQAVNLKSAQGQVLEFLFFLCFAVFGLFGIKDWFKKANLFEFIVVLLLSLFFLRWYLNASNLYVKERNWFILMPFYIPIALIGYGQITKLATNKYLQFIIRACAFIVLSAVIVNGVKVVYGYNSDYTQRYYSQAETALQSMADYINKNTSEDTVLAATDWGVIPLFSQRKTIQVLNDDSADYKLSLARILQFNAEYLVILDNFAFHASARAMIKRYPEIFQLTADFSSDSEEKIGPMVSVYQINLEKIRNLIGQNPGAG